MNAFDLDALSVKIFSYVNNRKCSVNWLKH